MQLMVSILAYSSLFDIAHAFFADVQLARDRASSPLSAVATRSRRAQSAFPKSDANLFEWIGTIEGPAATVRPLTRLGSKTRATRRAP